LTQLATVLLEYLVDAIRRWNFAVEFWQFKKNKISNDEDALFYEIRWQNELLFKKLRQNFELNYFYSQTDSGIILK
jgi:hypothetical protein